jgi:mannose-1-phosphate guanylyltransferase
MVKVIILCGGTGSRLWPLSRKEKPKQFMKLPNAKYNLFQDTITRINKLEADCSELIIVSNNEIRSNTIESVQRIDPKCIVTYIWEPIMRNTGPAIGAVIAYIYGSDEDCIVWPSDHILSMDSFNKSIHEAKQYLDDSIITFGIKPTYPETGYGYITSTPDNRIDKFIEKPPHEVAKELITNPNCYWNSGIFYFRANTLVREYINQDPVMFEYIRHSIKKNGTHDIDIDAEIYARCENIAFDKLIMERTTRGRVIPFNGNWSDIGSWDSLSKLYTNNNTNNIMQLDNQNCHIFNYNDKQIISTIGLKDICVVNTPDALLIADLAQTQKVKTIYQQLDNAKSMYIQKHTKNDYVWGITEELNTNDHGIHISKFTINENFNFYEHRHNAPLYYIIPIHGDGILEVDDKQLPLKIHDKIIIGENNVYRITNVSPNEKLVFVEFRGE